MEVPLGASGAISVYNSSSGSVDVTADTAGAFSSGIAPVSTSGLLVGTISGLLANSFPPLQMPGALGPGQTVTLQVAGRSGIPATGASAVLLNLTAFGATAAGSLTAWAGITPPPGTTELSYPVLSGSNNLVTVPLSATGTISIYNQGSAPVLLTAVVQGWFTA